MDVALMTHVAEGDPPKAGGPSGQVPGGAGGARGDIHRQAEDGLLSRNRDVDRSRFEDPGQLLWVEADEKTALTAVDIDPGEL